LEEYRRFTLWSEQVALRLAQEQQWARLATFLHETGGVARDLGESLLPLRGNGWEIGAPLLRWPGRSAKPSSKRRRAPVQSPCSRSPSPCCRTARSRRSRPSEGGGTCRSVVLALGAPLPVNDSHGSGLPYPTKTEPLPGRNRLLTCPG